MSTSPRGLPPTDPIQQYTTYSSPTSPEIPFDINENMGNKEIHQIALTLMDDSRELLKRIKKGTISESEFEKLHINAKVLALTINEVLGVIANRIKSCTGGFFSSLISSDKENRLNQLALRQNNLSQISINVERSSTMLFAQTKLGLSEELLNQMGKNGFNTVFSDQTSFTSSLKDFLDKLPRDKSGEKTAIALKIYENLLPEAKEMFLQQLENYDSMTADKVVKAIVEKGDNQTTVKEIAIVLAQRDIIKRGTSFDTLFRGNNAPERFISNLYRKDYASAWKPLLSGIYSMDSKSLSVKEMVVNSFMDINKKLKTDSSLISNEARSYNREVYNSMKKAFMSKFNNDGQPNPKERAEEKAKTMILSMYFLRHVTPLIVSPPQELKLVRSSNAMTIGKILNNIALDVKPGQKEPGLEFAADLLDQPEIRAARDEIFASLTKNAER